MRIAGFLLLGVLLLGCEPRQPASSIANYEEARAVFWRSLYSEDGKTLYCEKSFSTNRRAGINIEHVLPMGWVTNSLRCGTRKQCRKASAQFNRIEADLHNLYPSRSDVNYQRSAFAFGEIPGERRIFGSRCDFEVDPKARLAEPSPAIRGEVARAMFYMVDRYREHGLKLFTRQRRLLAEWHEADPPSKHEQWRNDRIEQLQGNRNPFIDRPELLSQKLARGEFD